MHVNILPMWGLSASSASPKTRPQIILYIHVLHDTAALPVIKYFPRFGCKRLFACVCPPCGINHLQGNPSRQCIKALIICKALKRFASRQCMAHSAHASLIGSQTDGCQFLSVQRAVRASPR